MGARESRPNDESAGTTTDSAIEDYYALLEVEENATSDDIKVCVSLYALPCIVDMCLINIVRSARFEGWRLCTTPTKTAKIRKVQQKNSQHYSEHTR